MPETMPFSLENAWRAWREQVESALAVACPPRVPTALWEAMRYSLLAGGKRLRPALVGFTLEALGADPTPALPAAAAIEMIHTQSLIHDDLPAMDNDDLRRGRPTNHKVYGEATAILAGDAMLAEAFALLAGPLAKAYPAEVCLEVTFVLASATVAMVEGQVVDMGAEGRPVTPETLEFIHRHKTGALISAAVRMGALLGGASAAQEADLARYAAALGLAFQIADDIQDVTKSAAELGKTPGKDMAAGKATYVALYGLEAARAELAATCAEATAALAAWGPEAAALRALAEFVSLSDR